MEINEIIERMYQASGVHTDTALAKAVSVHPSQVSRWRTHDKPSAHMINYMRKFAHKYNTTLDYLLEGVEKGGDNIVEENNWQRMAQDLMAMLQDGQASYREISRKLDDLTDHCRKLQDEIRLLKSGGSDGGRTLKRAK